MPNRLQPPQVPKVPAVLPQNPANKGPPAPDPLPTVAAASARPALASPKGASTSLWQALEIDGAGFRAKYLLFNPASGLYLGQPAASTPADGSPVVAADLARYVKDAASWLQRNPKADHKPVVAAVDGQLHSFVWTLQRADLGPAAGM
jgi:hypothetical protein